MEQYTPLTITIKPDQVDRIDRAAVQRGMSRSEFMRWASLFAASLAERPGLAREIRELVAERERTYEGEERERVHAGRAAGVRGPQGLPGNRGRPEDKEDASGDDD